MQPPPPHLCPPPGAPCGIQRVCPKTPHARPLHLPYPARRAAPLEPHFASCHSGQKGCEGRLGREAGYKVLKQCSCIRTFTSKWYSHAVHTHAVHTGPGGVRMDFADL
eukprot:111935-Chlamydomonas_euryale.AAC.1